MKKYKKIISAVTAIMIGALFLSAEFLPIISNFPTSYAEEISVTEDGFRYHTYNELSVIIESYEGTETDVIVPSEINGYRVQNYSDRLFADNQTIKTVDLSKCKKMGSGWFANSSVESVILPKNIKYIPNNTFTNCKNLKNVKFGDNILVIPASAFEGSDYILPTEMADKIRNADCENSSSCYFICGDWSYYTVANGKNGCIRKYLGNDTDIIIPETIDDVTITKIDETAFNEKVVNSIVFPKTVSFFGNFDFKASEEFKNISFNSPDLEIGYNAEFKKYGIEEITLPYLYRNIIQSQTFKDSETIKKFEFTEGKGELEIDNYAFENCSALDTVTFNGYDSINLGNFVFRNSSINRLELNADCTVKPNTFSGCNNLREIVFNGNVSAYQGIFRDCPINNIIFDNMESSVSASALDGAVTLMNINSESAFDESTGDFNAKYKDFIIKNFSGSDDVGFINEYVMWHVRDIVNRYTDDSMSDMEKVKVLHDWVCKNVSYSTKDIVGAEEHNDLSPFLTGVTVCDGYARSLNLLLHEAGIETYQVSSNNHIWNIVKIGGYYFHVDTTWDDSEEISNDWFLKSDAEISAETTAHSQWKLMMPSSLHSFQGDIMPKCSYVMGDCNTDGSISVSDIVKMNMYLLGTQSVNADDVVLYDLDFNGSVDVFDMVEMRKLVTEKPVEDSCLEDINLMNEWLIGKSDYIKPELDMNGDGKIDVFDMIILRQNLA